MAPDISQLGAHGSDYSEPSESYSIPDITFCDPQNRKLKVLTIGAGVSGILMAYQIQKQCEKYDVQDLCLVVTRRYLTNLKCGTCHLREESRHWWYLVRKSVSRLCL
jgi:hypothetical protein